jgi:hypothetical protein
MRWVDRRHSSSPDSQPQASSISGRKIECRKIQQATPARHFSDFNFSAYLPSIGPRRTTSSAIAGLETIGRSVPIS